MTHLSSVRCRLWLVAALLAIAAPLPGQSAPAVAAAEPTTVVLVRHAEKATDDPRDPSLSEAGRRRAEALLSALEATDVAAVYVTQCRRTQETAAPLTARVGLSAVERPVSDVNAAGYARELAREILTAHTGRTVLVVGHSNTVPDLVEALSGRTVPPIEETEYDHLFVVVVPASGPPRLLQVRYGAPGA